MPDIQKVQRYWKDKFLAASDSLEQAVVKLPPAERSECLTRYANNAGNSVVNAWQKLGNLLVVKYNDGYIKDAAGSTQTVPYPQSWYKMVQEADKIPGYIIPEASQNQKLEYQPF